MKKDNISKMSWLLRICGAIKQAKHSSSFMPSEAESSRPFIQRICDICNEAIEKIENEIEKLD